MLYPEFKHIGIPEIICITGIIGLCLVTINYLLHYLPFSRFKSTHLAKNDKKIPISVVICAKNEDDKLTEFLPKVLTQEYPEFEVIVVNDCSWDNTETVIDEFAAIFPNLRKANIKEDPYYKHGKKFAMLVGIKAARYENLVFTDADCYPTSSLWLEEMAAGFAEGQEIVLGYGVYEKHKSMLNKLIRFDTANIAAGYFTAAIRKKAYMGIGRNLAYTKSLFFANKGFSSHYHIQSGDDDLFVNEASTSTNTNICVTAGASTLSVPEKTFRNWRLQKARHLTTAGHYRSNDLARLFFNYFSLYFFHISLVLQLVRLETLVLFPALLVTKGLIQILIFNKGFKKLQEKDLVLLSPLLEILLLFIYPVFQISKITEKKQKWNH